MRLDPGKPVFVYGKHHEIIEMMHSMSVSLQKRSKVLFIDTDNSLNPHSIAYDGMMQKRIFSRIYCVRTPKPYDLLTRLKTSDRFIRTKGIGVLLVSSLTKFFEDLDKEEITFLIGNILGWISSLTKKYNLITVIGNIPHSDQNSLLASEILLRRQDNLVIS
jgi:hypothetical protein